MKKLVLALSAISLVACNSADTTPEEAQVPILGFDLANLDTTVAPCEDFFQYTAGGWIKANPIPASEAKWGSFNILIEENNKKVKGLLDSVAKEDNLEKGSYQQMVSDFYATGMDSMAVENAGITALQSYFEKIEAISSHEDYIKLMAEFKKLSVSHPWYMYVGVDDKNSNAYILNIGQSGLGLPDRDYYLKTDSLSEVIKGKYKTYMANILSMTYAEETEVDAESVYRFEESLAKISMSRVDRRDPYKTYNKMSKSDIEAMAPVLNFNHYFASNNIEFDSAVVAQPDYIKAVGGIISATNVEVLKTYARWNFIRNYIGFLPNNFVAESFEFNGKVLQGKKEMKPRWKRVLSAINSGLGEALGHLFVDRYFPESSKKDIENMIEEMRVVYRERIGMLEWMGEETKQKALEKLNAFKYKIGYPNTWDTFEGLTIENDTYLANAMRLDAYGVQDNLQKLGKPVDKDEWFMPAHIVNAYYSSGYNEIVFPAGILQPPFYNPEAEAAINYGGIGGVIGHEFTHGFDDKGSQYDAHGNLSDWWTENDRTLFDERTAKMVAQYSGYQPILDTYVNGNLTLGENIADLGGLTLGYYSYKKSLENGREDVVIDGYTWQQRIFLGWAQVWQANQTDEYTRNQVVTDPHSPAKYRVNGPMGNMKEFRDAWGCNEGDPMIRPDSVKVIIW